MKMEINENRKYVPTIDQFLSERQVNEAREDWTSLEFNNPRKIKIEKQGNLLQITSHTDGHVLMIDRKYINDIHVILDEISEIDPSLAKKNRNKENMGPYQVGRTFGNDPRIKISTEWELTGYDSFVIYNTESSTWGAPIVSSLIKFNVNDALNLKKILR